MRKRAEYHGTFRWACCRSFESQAPCMWRTSSTEAFWLRFRRVAYSLIPLKVRRASEIGFICRLIPCLVAKFEEA